MLTLPRKLQLTPPQFAEVCAANPEAVLELEADGTLIEMNPAGGETGARNQALGALLWLAVRQGGLPFKVFDSSAGFLLPDGSVRSPDASVVRLDRWRQLSDSERSRFPPLCPDLVVELASPSDQLEESRRRMAQYLANGARLGWLLVPQGRRVEVWRTGEESRKGNAEPQVFEHALRLDAGPELPGLVIELDEVWAG